jgi:hypothetical protein
MENASYATLMFDSRRKLEFATSAVTEMDRGNALSVEARELATPFTVALVL